MQLKEIKHDGKTWIKFSADENATPAELEAIKVLANYDIIRHGASFQVRNHKDQLMLQINPFDNTIFICDPSAIELANIFGAKRFPVGAALKTLSEQTNEKDEIELDSQFTPDKKAKVVKFGRDYAFPLATKNENRPKYTVATFDQLLQIYKSNKSKLVETLSALFIRCADFTPGKQQEYLEGGNLNDKFCRFNLNDPIRFMCF